MSVFMPVHRFIHYRLRHSQVMRFLVVGSLNTAFSYGIYAGLIFVGLNYALANLLALVVGILFSFKTQGHLVFNNSENRLLGRFVLVWAFIYLCTIGIIRLLISTGMNAYEAGLVAVPFSAVLSFLFQKYFVFRTSRVDPQSTLMSEERS